MPSNNVLLKALRLISLLQSILHVQPFAPLNRNANSIITRNILNSKTEIYSNHIDNSDSSPFSNEDGSMMSSTRKEFILSSSGAALTAAAAAMTNTIQPAFADDTIDATTTNNGPITIVGSNGKTGSECVGACLARSIPVRATSRSGVYSGVYADGGEVSKKLLSMMPCDVTVPSTVESAVEGSRAVIFAASASKQGGTAAAVDNEGLVNVAKACIAAKVPSLVIVSSGGVSKPDSPVYKFLNLFGKIMEEKIKGEDTVRALYKDCGSTCCTYTVIRPGGLTEEEARGVSALELNQGDTKSGRISRADVASLCIESSVFTKLAGGCTYECYDADTAKPLSTVGMSNIMKAKNKSDDGVFISGKERRGDTWEKILTGLEKD